MESWYCKEFISSSQTAARLVFNINNCVDLSKVLQLRPNRPPDAKGRESFVYIMDGAVVRSIKDLPIDELTPWNSKKCKSSTRFSSVQFDGEKNSLVFNRYIISDASNVERPECLLACYYCKHPIFNLVKKIYYACDANRERCLPGTFVIFIYEFAHAANLYRTYGAYRVSANASMASQQNSSQSLSTMESPSQPQNVHQQSNSIQRHFENASLKIEDFIMDGSPDEAYEMDTYLQGTPNTSCLEDILEACNSMSMKRTAAVNYPETNCPTNSTPAGFLPHLKRIKRSASGQPDHENDASSNSMICSNAINESAHFRHFFTTEALMENFRKNCLCDKEKLSELFERMDDQSVKNAENNDDENTCNSIEGEPLPGGCLLVDSTFVAETLYFTILWFRNSTFLDSNDLPLIHPIAALISTEAHSDDQQYLLNQFGAKLDEADTKGICRSTISDCSNSDTDLPVNSSLFSYPCVRLVPIDQLKQIVHQKIVSLNEEEHFNKIDEDLFLPGSGLLKSLLTFEHFVRKLRTVEKGWPNGFRMWFREKSGWIYERSSLISHIKAGFTSKNAGFNMCGALATLKENFKQNLLAATDEFCDNDSHVELETATSTMEQFFTDLLVRVVQSMISSTKGQQIDTHSVKIHPSKEHLWINSEQWSQLSSQERRQSLASLGLSALSAAGTFSANSLDPLIFAGLSRSHKMDLLSRANTLDVLILPDNIQKQRFIVEDSTAHRAFYVKNESGSVQCQCQQEAAQTSLSCQLCEHILAVALKDISFARKIGEVISQNRTKTATTSIVNGLHLHSSPMVEIICCSSNGTSP